MVYPPTAPITPTPAQVTLLNDSPENEGLQKWLDARDPSKAAASVEPARPETGEVRYVPSYMKEHTLPSGEVQASEPVTFPPARNPLAPTAKSVARIDAPHGAVRSRLIFSEGLRGRNADTSPALPAGAKSSHPLQPSRFLLAVSDRGEVRYCFLQGSCGDREIDREAEDVLRQHAFKHTNTPTPLAWGFAIFVWGIDRFAPATPEPEAHAGKP